MIRNRVLLHIPARHACPTCLNRERREQLLNDLRERCKQVEELSGGVIDFILLKADCLDDEADDYQSEKGEENRKLHFINHARVHSVPVTSETVETLDVAAFTVSELRRIAGVFTEAADAIEATRIYFPPAGTIENSGDDDDRSGDCPVESGE